MAKLVKGKQHNKRYNDAWVKKHGMTRTEYAKKRATVTEAKRKAHLDKIAQASKERAEARRLKRIEAYRKKNG